MNEETGTTRIIAIANQKGGVGKTTTSVNLAASLAATHKRVMLIDMDAQGNATMGSGVDKHNLDNTILEVLLGEAKLTDALIQTGETQYALVPSNATLTAAKVDLLGIENREFQLRNQLKPVVDDYDYILIDCPPALDMLTVNALVAAKTVLIPMQCEYFALEGLSDLVETIEAISETVNPELRLEGLLRTMFDPRSRLAREVSNQLSKHFGDKLYRTVIPRNVRLAEAPSYGQAIFDYDRRSKGAIAYLALAGEFIRRYGEQEQATQHARSD